MTIFLVFLIGVGVFLPGMAQEIGVLPEEVHPLVLDTFEAYPPLQKGGYRIENYDAERYLVVGIGKGKRTKTFADAVKKAELDAEVQIGKALNPTEITVQNMRKATVTKDTNNGAEIQKHKKKLTQMLLSAYTPSMASCGIWQKGDIVYYAKCVFIGEFNHFSNKGKRGDISNFSLCGTDLPEWISSLPYLAKGGTIQVKAEGKDYLVTVALVPQKLPSHQKLKLGRIQASKNLLAFVNGKGIEQLIAVLSESFYDKSGIVLRKDKRRELVGTVQGKSQYMEPLATWSIVGVDYDAYLYVLPISIGNP